MHELKLGHLAREISRCAFASRSERGPIDTLASRIAIGGHLCGGITNRWGGHAPGPVPLDAATSTARRRALPCLARQVDIRYSGLSVYDILIGMAGAIFDSLFGTPRETDAWSGREQEDSAPRGGH